MKTRWLISLLAIFFFLPMTIYAEPSSKIIQLNHISDEALQMVKSHRYQEGLKLLEVFSSQLLTKKEQMFTGNELRIISVAHQEAVEATANSELSHEEIVSRVTKFRLAIDALLSSQQPLWTEMEDPIMSVFENVKNAAYNGNNVHFHANLNSFLSMYETIYPSLKIDIPKEQIQRLDAKVNYIDSFRPQVLSETVNRQELEALGGQLQSIFDGVTEDEADPSLWWVIISTGSIIILTLSYVGWRKYKGYHEQERSQRTEKD